MNADAHETGSGADQAPEYMSDPAQDQIAVTQEVIQGLLELLGEAWAQIEVLRAAGPPAGQAAPGATADAVPPERPEQGKGILIIDDSRVLQQRLRVTVESLGYHVIGIADNGRVGAELALELKPRLIILDNEMPVMDGLECLKAIQKVLPQTQVIVCSATLTAKVAQDYALLGVNEMVTKPVQLNLLIRSVKHAMGDW